MASEPQPRKSLQRRSRPNGDVYVYERTTIYDPETRRTRQISSKLIGKIPKGETEMVPTRHRSSPGEDDASDIIQTFSILSHTDMMDILDFIGKTSGIDKALYAAIGDEEIVQKVISLARYLFVNMGWRLSDIIPWQYQYRHRHLPWKEEFTSETIRDLLECIGMNEWIPQRFFMERARNLSDPSCIGLDISLADPSDSRCLILVSRETHEPLAWVMEPCDLLSQKVGELIGGPHLYRKGMDTEFLIHRIHFLMSVDGSLKWTWKNVHENWKKIQDKQYACRSDPCIRGITCTHTKMYCPHTEVIIGNPAPNKVEKTLYLHLYYDEARARAEREFLQDQIQYISKKLKEVPLLEDLSKQERRIAKKYLILGQNSQGLITSVDLNAESFEKATTLSSMFALFSDQETDASSALEAYLGRETTEEYFHGIRADEETFAGAMFLQFVSFCYYSFYTNEINAMKKTLGQPNGDPRHDTPENLEAEKHLLSWLNQYDTPEQLTWFDAMDVVDGYKNKVERMRWSEESLQQDRLFLTKLGMKNIH